MNALEGVVGVDQEDAVVGHGSGVLLEGRCLVIEGHHPAVCVGAVHGDAEQLAGQDVGGRVASSDVGGPAGGQRAIDTLSASQPELQHRIAAGHRETRAAFVAISVWKLTMFSRAVSRIWHWRIGPRTRTSGCWERPPYLPESRRRRIRIPMLRGTSRSRGRTAAGRRSRSAPRDSRDRPRRSESSEVVDGKSQAGRDRVTARKRVLAKEQMKDRLLFVAARLPVPVGHGELIQVGQQGQRGGRCPLIFPSLHSCFVSHRLSVLNTRTSVLSSGETVSRKSPLLLR